MSGFRVEVFRQWWGTRRYEVTLWRDYDGIEIGTYRRRWVALRVGGRLARFLDCPLEDCRGDASTATVRL